MSGEIIGSKIQNYRVVGQIGRGGMGNVYEARHEQIDRRAAIKVLHPEFARDAEMAQRFFNEARAVNVVGHPGLVNIYELGSLETGAAYIIMEYLEGDSLRQRMRRPGGCQEEEALRIARQIAGALQAVHAKGIIHRDLKPDNIILVADSEVSGGERAKVLDFGIAKLLHGGESGRGPTHTGAVVGTPAYMAPEQCGMRMPVSDRTDVYALGIMLFEMLAGKPPFFGEGPTALIGQHLFVDPPPLPQKVSPDTAALVLRMLAKAPADRPSMVEVATTLSSLGDFSRISRMDLAAPIAALTPQPSGGAAAVAAASSGSGIPAVAASSSGGAPAIALTTIGQSTGERVPAAQSSSKWSPLFVAAIATMLTVSAAGTLWLMFGYRPGKPSSLTSADTARGTAPKATQPALATVSASAASPLPAVNSGPPRVDPTPMPTPIQPVATAPLPGTTLTPGPAQPPPTAIPAAPVAPQSAGPAPAPATPPTAAVAAASCQELFARKRYIDAIASCNTALASNPNQPAVRLTLRNAVARLAATQRSRPHAPPPSASPPSAPPPPSRVEPPVAPAPPVKEHYEKVQPID